MMASELFFYSFLLCLDDLYPGGNIPTDLHYKLNVEVLSRQLLIDEFVKDNHSQKDDSSFEFLPRRVI